MKKNDKGCTVCVRHGKQDKSRSKNIGEVGKETVGTCVNVWTGFNWVCWLCEHGD